MPRRLPEPCSCTLGRSSGDTGVTGDFAFFVPERRILPGASDPGDEVSGPHGPPACSAQGDQQVAALLSHASAVASFQGSLWAPEEYKGHGWRGSWQLWHPHSCEYTGTRHMHMRMLTLTAEGAYLGISFQNILPLPGRKASPGHLPLRSPFRRGTALFFLISPFPNSFSEVSAGQHKATAPATKII